MRAALTRIRGGLLSTGQRWDAMRGAGSGGGLRTAPRGCLARNTVHDGQPPSHPARRQGMMRVTGEPTQEGANPAHISANVTECEQLWQRQTGGCRGSASKSSSAPPHWDGGLQSGGSTQTIPRHPPSTHHQRHQRPATWHSANGLWGERWAGKQEGKGQPGMGSGKGAGKGDTGGEARVRSGARTKRRASPSGGQANGVTFGKHFATIHVMSLKGKKKNVLGTC